MNAETLNERNIKEAKDKASEKIKEVKDNIKDQITEYSDDVVEYIKKSPIKSVAIAAGAGVLLALFLGK